MTYKYNITHSFDVTSDVCYKTLIPWLPYMVIYYILPTMVMLYYIYNTQEWRHNLIVRLHRATRLRVVALNKSLTMIMTSFLCVINVI